MQCRIHIYIGFRTRFYSVNVDYDILCFSKQTAGSCKTVILFIRYYRNRNLYDFRRQTLVSIILAQFRISVFGKKVQTSEISVIFGRRRH